MSLHNTAARIADRHARPPADPTWVESRDRGKGAAYGTRPPMSARQIERAAEHEYARMTSGGFDPRAVCGVCHLAQARNGSCECFPDGLTSRGALLAQLGLAVPPDLIRTPAPIMARHYWGGEPDADGNLPPITRESVARCGMRADSLRPVPAVAGNCAACESAIRA